jgi:hypothetical protein
MAKPTPPAPVNDPVAASAADLAGRDPDTLTDAEIKVRYAAANAARARAFRLVLLRQTETMVAELTASLEGAGRTGGGDWD